MSKIPQGEWNAIAARYANGESISRIARSYGCTPPAIHYILKRHRERPVPAVAPPVGAQHFSMLRAKVPESLPAPPQPAGKSLGGSAAPADYRGNQGPGLDRALHDRAEAAIELFRSSFDAALMEGSPDVRERLRQAASDLMRVAARTTIELDRLNASAERSGRAQTYPRSPHAREDAGNFGAG